MTDADRKVRDSAALHIKELRAESSRLAKREGVDSVSEIHVDEARRLLSIRKRRRFNWPTLVGASGGVLAGAGLGDWVAQSHAHNPPFENLAVATVLLVVGALFVVLAAVAETR